MTHNELIGVDWQDYTYEIEFKIDQNTGGFVFRAQDEGNLYYWQVASKEELGRDEAYLRPHVRENGAYAVLKEIPIGDVVGADLTAESHQIRIDAQGSDITTSIDGQEVDSLTDTTHSAGTIGFRQGGGEICRYRQVDVTAADGEGLYEDDFSSPETSKFDPDFIEDGELVLDAKTVLLLGQGVGDHGGEGANARPFPLLDGETLDLNHVLDGSENPEPRANKTVVLHEDFAREELPWWLDFSTDNGGIAFDGLMSAGDSTEVTLGTGTANVGDVTVLEGPTVNWTNWSEVRFFAWGVSVSDTDARGFCNLADARNDNDIQEGFRIRLVADGRGGTNGWFPRIFTNGGNLNATDDTTVDATVPHDYGAEIYTNERGPGYQVGWIKDAQPWAPWTEDQGFPESQPLTFYFGVRTADTGADHTITIDGIRIELVP